MCSIIFYEKKKYKDSDWCDVMLMNTCYILLGRLWKYDRCILNNKWYNIYTPSIKGKCIVLIFMRKWLITEIDLNQRIILSL